MRVPAHVSLGRLGQGSGPAIDASTSDIFRILSSGAAPLTQVSQLEGKVGPTHIFRVTQGGIEFGRVWGFASFTNVNVGQRSAVVFFAGGPRTGSVELIPPGRLVTGGYEIPTPKAIEAIQKAGVFGTGVTSTPFGSPESFMKRLEANFGILKSRLDETRAAISLRDFPLAANQNRLARQTASELFNLFKVFRVMGIVSDDFVDELNVLLDQSARLAGEITARSNLAVSLVLDIQNAFVSLNNRMFASVMADLTPLVRMVLNMQARLNARVKLLGLLKGLGGGTAQAVSLIEFFTADVNANRQWLIKVKEAIERAGFTIGDLAALTEIGDAPDQLGIEPATTISVILVIVFLIQLGFQAFDFFTRDAQDQKRRAENMVDSLIQQALLEGREITEKDIEGFKKTVAENFGIDEQVLEDMADLSVPEIKLRAKEAEARIKAQRGVVTPEVPADAVRKKGVSPLVLAGGVAALALALFVFRK